MIGAFRKVILSRLGRLTEVLRVTGYRRHA
jgi:hypothetical protein